MRVFPNAFTQFRAREDAACTFTEYLSHIRVSNVLLCVCPDAECKSFTCSNRSTARLDLGDLDPAPRAVQPSGGW
jgi:hypothetical protein